jgi:hypothetical protein
VRARSAALTAGVGAALLVTLPDCVFDTSAGPPEHPLGGCWSTVAPEDARLDLRSHEGNLLRGVLRLGPSGADVLYTVSGEAESDDFAVLEGFRAGPVFGVHRIVVLRSIDGTLSVNIDEGPPHGPLQKGLCPQ